MTKQQQSDRDEVIARLRETLKPGDKLYTVLRSVSRSGMSRLIDVYRFDADGGKHWLSGRIARACDFPIDQKSGAIKISGGGMDMGFEIVYQLGRKLFPDGFGTLGTFVDSPEPKVTMRAATREEAIAFSAIQGIDFRGRNGDTSGWDSDGGFALRQEWL